MKRENLKRLKDLYLREHYKKFPNFPEYAKVTPSYSDKTANKLTKCVIDWLRLSGWQAERINTMGRPIDNTKVITDVLGGKRRIGSIQWIKGSGQKGSADISTVVCARSIKVEVKMKDRQSLAQQKYQQDIERSGGIYLLIRNFDDFLQWYDTFLKETCAACYEPNRFICDGC